MHHSKKELLAKRWNQILSLDLSDKIEEDDLINDYYASEQEKDLNSTLNKK